MCTLAVSSFFGCGDWSNRDLDFVAGLPSRAPLLIRMPGAADTTGADTYAVGTRSPGYSETRRAAVDFDALVTALFGAIDSARTVSPSGRTESTRSWGPFQDSENLGVSFTVVEEQRGPRVFSTTLTARRNLELPIDVLTSEVTIGEAEGHRQGQAHLHVREAAAVVRVTGLLLQLDRLDATYVLEPTKRSIALGFSFSATANGSLSPNGLVFEGDDLATGALRAQLKTQEALFDVQARWLTSGAGSQQATVVEGNATARNQCWDGAFKTTYFDVNGMMGGSPSDCPSFGGL